MKPNLVSLKLFTGRLEVTHTLSGGFTNSWRSPGLESHSFLRFECNKKEQTHQNLHLFLIIPFLLFQNSLKWRIIISLGYNPRHKQLGCPCYDSLLCRLQFTRKRSSSPGPCSLLLTNSLLAFEESRSLTEGGYAARLSSQGQKWFSRHVLFITLLHHLTKKTYFPYFAHDCQHKQHKYERTGTSDYLL